MNFTTVFYSTYILLITFALLNAFVMDISRKKLVIEPFVFTIVMVGFFIYFFGTREYNIGVDTSMYAWQYNNYEKMNYGQDFLLPFLIKTMHLISPNPRIFFVFMAVFSFVPMVIALRKISIEFDANWFLVFFTYTSFFFFVSLGINVVRQAVSLSFLMLAITNFNLGKGGKESWIIPLIFSLGFHFTSIVPIAIFFFVIAFRRFNLLYFYVIYFGTIFFASLNLSILQLDIIGQVLMDDRRSVYLTGESDTYEVGFKSQFVLFNTLFLGVFTFINRALKDSKIYRFLLIYYLLISSFFFMTFQMPFSDRWGVISWVTIPFLLSPVFSLRFAYRIAILVVILLGGIFVFFQNYS